MLTRVPAFLLLVGLGLACSPDGPTAGVQGTPTPVATPTLPYDTEKVEIAHGAIGTLYYRTAKQGNLRVEVESRRTPSGSVTSVTYERAVDCDLDAISPGRYSAGCDVAWTVRQTVGTDAFTVDATLDTATFTGAVRGKKVRVTWTGYGEARRQANQNGNLLVEMRTARATVTWGPDRYADPERPTAPATLYRRVTELSRIAP